MKKVSIIITSIGVVIATAVIACNSDKSPSANNEGVAEVKSMNETNVDPAALVQRGQYLVTIMACHDCHSPKIMTPHGPKFDSSRLLSGHPSTNPNPKLDTTEIKSWILFGQDLTTFVGPWGVSYSANLTSDETGVGNWSEAQFFKAIREGKYKGMDNTRPLLPPMPWNVYRNASDEDLRAIFAYLKSTKPIENRVPAPVAPNQLSTFN